MFQVFNSPLNSSPSSSSFLFLLLLSLPPPPPHIHPTLTHTHVHTHKYTSSSFGCPSVVVFSVNNTLCSVVQFHFLLFFESDANHFICFSKYVAYNYYGSCSSPIMRENGLIPVLCHILIIPPHLVALKSSSFVLS